MNVNKLAEILDAVKLNVEDGERVIETGYAGDLLSFVMGRAPENSAWFTIMTNVNILAVATLTEVSVIVVCVFSIIFLKEEFFIFLDKPLKLRYRQGKHPKFYPLAQGCVDEFYRVFVLLQGEDHR